MATNLHKVISEALLSDSPDLSQIKADLEDKWNLESEAQDFIYAVTAKLNSRFFPPITNLELILTEGCNLACSYCFEKDMLGYKRMPLEIAQASIDLLFDYAQDESDLYITHFGGEPLMNFPAIQHVTEYTEHKALSTGKNIHFKMTTNGYLLTEPKVEYLAQHKIGVLLSIDGLESTHDRYRIDKRGRGTFKKVIEGLNRLKTVQPWIGAKMTVMPENAPNLFTDVLGLYDLGVNQFIIGYATGIKWSEEEMACYAEQLAKVFQWYQERSHHDLLIADFDEIDMETSFFGCQAGRSSISVTINGEISPCSKILALDNKRLLAKLGDVQYGLTHLRNRFNLVSCSQLQAACEAEGIAEDFQGGCFVENYDDNRDLFQPSMQGYTFSKHIRSACAGCSASGTQTHPRVQAIPLIL